MKILSTKNKTITPKQKLDGCSVRARMIAVRHEVEWTVYSGDKVLRSGAGRLSLIRIGKSDWYLAHAGLVPKSL